MNEEKVLTAELVKKLGLDKLEVITSDMLDGYTRIGYSAFDSCFCITSITIPNSITSIGDYAFYECSALTSITLPNSVTSIGDSVFEGCSSLTSITIPNSVTSIGKLTFYGCSSLTSITLPNSVISIGDGAFAYCFSLTSITLPNSVTYIGSGAFCDCNKLKNIIISNKTYKIQEVVNGKCKAYKVFNGGLTCRDFQYEEDKTYEIEDNPILCRHGFHACLRLTDIFNYYNGKIGKDIVVHEVELEGVSEERYDEDSKVVAKKITIGKRIL